MGEHLFVRRRAVKITMKKDEKKINKNKKQVVKQRNKTKLSCE